jgi:uncharacterized protein
MYRLLFAGLLAWIVGVSGSVATAAKLPRRPKPFTFVTDRAHLLSPAETQQLERGLRRYADANGTQMVVVTVPNLGGRTVADYGRALGTAWGVGQRGKNNGLVLLVAAREHKVTIQAGRGLRKAITPAVTDRVIKQQLTPFFKQGQYFAGLRAGLNTLLLVANPASDPRLPANGAEPIAEATPPVPVPTVAAPDSARRKSSVEAESMTEREVIIFSLTVLLPLCLGILYLLFWLLRKLLRLLSGGRAPATEAPAAYQAGPPSHQGSWVRSTTSTSPRRVSRWSTSRTSHPHSHHHHSRSSGGHGAADSGPDYFSEPETIKPDTGPDYFSEPKTSKPDTGPGFFSLFKTNKKDSDPDYFSEPKKPKKDYFGSSKRSAYDDPSSGDTGGGGFDDRNDNSGSW